MEKITIIDATLRDGSHALSHSFEVEQVQAIVKGLDEAGTEYIEIAHGDGVGGATINYGFSKVDEFKLIEAACKTAKKAKITILLLPGIGRIEDIDHAISLGVKAIRVATHVTEADISEQHIKYAKEKGLEVFGFLMMAHMAPPEKVLEEALKMESYGADALYLADSSGHMITDDVSELVTLMKNNLKIPIGFHAHNNLGLAIANTVAAAKAGASFVDGTLRGLGAGSGNAQEEVLNCVLDRYSFKTDVDEYKLMDVAEKVVEPIMKRPQIINTASLMLGVAGVYSSFLLHVYKASEKFNIEPRDILVELGKRKMVGGQEDKIIEVAYELANK